MVLLLYVVQDVEHILVFIFILGPSGTYKYTIMPNTQTDGIYLYACEILSLGLVYLEFCESVKEGDGDRFGSSYLLSLQGK